MKNVRLVYCVAAFFVTKMHAEILGPYLLSPDKIPATLSSNGQIYALSSDVVGNITITANDVTINLNERTVTGRIIISGERVIIYGGKIVAPTPADNATADAGVVQINASATNAQIIDCYISAADTTVVGVRGARGMQIDADDVIIRNSFVQAGNSGSVNGLADGGIGIQSSANNLMIDNSQLFGGNGSDSNSSIITTGNGGIGLMMTAGVGIRCINSAISGGNAGSATGGADSVTLANGGHGVGIDAGVEVILGDNIIVGGLSSTITGSAIATVGNVIAGNGGDGIHSAAANLVIQQSNLSGGNVGTTTATGTNIGGAFSLTAGSGGAGMYLESLSLQTEISFSTLTGGDSGLVETTAVPSSIDNVIGGQGGHGIDIHQVPSGVILPEAIINNCVVIGGRGQNIQSSDAIATTNPVNGNSAGFALALVDDNVVNVVMNNCQLQTQLGGSVVVTGLSGGTFTGGNGGDAIVIMGANIAGVTIAHNSVLHTGAGGDASASLNGIGGNGGNGIIIGANVSDAGINNNTITNTGVGGTGDALSGVGGQAIVSTSASAGMIIYGNYAYSIATTPVYAITAGHVDGNSKGTAYTTASGTNFLFNIHKP